MTEYVPVVLVAFAVVGVLWRGVELWFRQKRETLTVENKRAQESNATNTKVLERLEVYEKALANSIKQFTDIVKALESARNESQTSKRMSAIMPGRRPPGP